MKDKRRQQAGETLVEVLAAFAVLALFAALFLGSVRFSGRMLERSEEEETAAFRMLQALYAGEGQATPQPEETYTFVLPDGTQAFSITPPRQTMDLTVEQDGQSRQYTLRQFAGEEDR